MNTEDQKNNIADFLKRHSLAVMSTVDSDGMKPESAVVGFAETTDLELIVGTSNTSRKYKNLQKNPKVSFVIGWSFDGGTLQYEGVARELSEEQAAIHSAALFAKVPQTQKAAKAGESKYFLVKPTWVRLVDLAQKPVASFEARF